MIPESVIDGPMHGLVVVEGQTKSISGRLSWSSSKGIWCIDVDSKTDSGISDITGAEDLLNQLASDPSQSLSDIENGTQFNISGVISGSTLMKNDGDTKVIIANAPYPNTLTKFDAYIPLECTLDGSKTVNKSLQQ